MLFVGINIPKLFALSNKFALVNSEQDLLDDKYYAAFLRDNDFRDVKKKCEFEVKYPLSKDDDPTGSIVIWEHPV